MSNWLFDMFDGKDDKINKEAELINQGTEWDRKVEENAWIKDVMSLDEDAIAREAEKKQAAEEQVQSVEEPFDQVGAIMEYEQGSLSDADTLKLFSHLIKTGLAWSLQGHYGRTAKALIDAGWLDEQGTILKELPAAPTGNEKTCEYCGQEIFDKREESGATDVDWATAEGDFGCDESPETTEEGVGNHKPVDHEACMASFKASIQKKAAYDRNDDAGETVKKDYDLEVKTLSDYNLAEMLAEYVCLENNTATLNFNEEKETQLKSVKSGRDASEKKLLKYLGDHTLIDWKKSFKDMEKSEVKHADEKDLYSKWKEGKMAWDKDTTFDSPSDKEKLEQMEGVGKEEEKGQVGKEAALKSVEEKVEKKLNQLIDQKLEEAFNPAPELPEAMPTDALPMMDEPMPEEKLDDVIPEKLEDEKAASLKKADFPMDMPPAAPAPTEDTTETPLSMELGLNDKPADAPTDMPAIHPMDDAAPEPSLDSPADPAQATLDALKSSLDALEVLVKDKPELHALIEETENKIFEIEKSLTGKVDVSPEELKEPEHKEVLETPAPEKKEDKKEEPKEEKKKDKPEDKKDEKKEDKKDEKETEKVDKEIESQASKEDVIKKVAEIASPWRVIKNDKGEEVIARISPLHTEKKSKETDLKKDINSQNII